MLVLISRDDHLTIVLVRDLLDFALQLRLEHGLLLLRAVASHLIEIVVVAKQYSRLKFTFRIFKIT